MLSLRVPLVNCCHFPLNSFGPPCQDKYGVRLSSCEIEDLSNLFQGQLEKLSDANLADISFLQWPCWHKERLLQATGLHNFHCLSRVNLPLPTTPPLNWTNKPTHTSTSQKLQPQMTKVQVTKPLSDCTPSKRPPKGSHPSITTSPNLCSPKVGRSLKATEQACFHQHLFSRNLLLYSDPFIGSENVNLIMAFGNLV